MSIAELTYSPGGTIEERDLAVRRAYDDGVADAVD